MSNIISSNFPPNDKIFLLIAQRSCSSSPTLHHDSDGAETTTVNRIYSILRRYDATCINTLSGRSKISSSRMHVPFPFPGIPSLSLPFGSIPAPWFLQTKESVPLFEGIPRNCLRFLCFCSSGLGEQGTAEKERAS